MFYHISVGSDELRGVNLHLDVIDVCAEESEDKDSEINRWKSREKESGKEEEKEHSGADENPNQPKICTEEDDTMVINDQAVDRHSS